MKSFFKLTLIASALLVAACESEKENSAKNSPLINESAVAVSLVAVQESAFSLPVVSSGIITTSTEARLSFKIGGIIDRLYVKEGETVKRGQLLASLTLTEIDAQVAQAQNSAEKAKRDYDRVHRLYLDSAATLEQVQNLKTTYDVAEEALQIARFNRQHATIHATANGKIIRKMGNAGEYVSAGSPVFILNAADENEWIVKLGLPDVDWVRVQKSDRATVVTDAYPGMPLEASVSLIGEGSDPLTGLYSVDVAVNPAGKKLATGLFASVVIQPSQTTLLKSIPVEALVEGKGKNAFVFVPEKDNKVRKVPVKIAYLHDNRAFIKEGLDHVPSVIHAGSAFLTEYSFISIDRTLTSK